ncbi:MAG: hypothetical protein JST86_06775 [Bacteroidetes bacterium]|nr:hypothetical protein [Bacteroidota bacterium]
MKQLPAIIVLTAMLASCSSSDKKTDAKKDKYQETVETLEQTEKKNPTKFISATASKKKGLLGLQIAVHITVTNNAKVAHYKDIKVKYTFYSKTGAVIEEDDAIIYESLAPGTSAKDTEKMFKIKGADSVGVKVMSATAE